MDVFVIFVEVVKGIKLIFPCLVKIVVSYKMSDEIYYFKIVKFKNGILVSCAALNIQYFVIKESSGLKSGIIIKSWQKSCKNI